MANDGMDVKPCSDHARTCEHWDAVFKEEIVIKVDEVRDENSNIPVAKLSEWPSKAWSKAFESVIAWTKKKGDKPDGLGDHPIPDAVIGGDFKLVQDELSMHLGFGKAWAHVREFIEDVAIAYANEVTG